MIDSFPDLYRISTDDGETADYTLNGLLSLDAGDEFVFQPDTTGAEMIGDSRLPLGKITMVTNRQGEVYLFPSNRLQDARPVTDGELLGLAFEYLASGPFITPAKFIHTAKQVAAMRTLLSVPADVAVEAPESPVEVPETGDPSVSTNEPDGDADEVVASPKAGAPAVDQSPSASPESESSPSRKRGKPSQPESQPESQPDSPDPAASLLPDDSPVATSSADGPVERVKATETLIVDVADPEPDKPDRMTITIDSGALSGTLGASPESSSPLVINVEDEPPQ